jgi:uncharacterized DUF497 family protein
VGYLCENQISGSKNSYGLCFGIDNVHTKLYIDLVIFEWDSKKNSENIGKHGISFEQAQEVFLDPLHLSILDERFSYFEERWITMGATQGGDVIVVAHLYYVEEPEERMRIISARQATPQERRQYEKIE